MAPQLLNRWLVGLVRWHDACRRRTFGPRSVDGHAASGHEQRCCSNGSEKQGDQHGDHDGRFPDALPTRRPSLPPQR